MADFTQVSETLAALQAAILALSGAIELKAAADAALLEAQGIAAVTARQVVEADGVADQALEALVAALEAVGVGPSVGLQVPD